MNISQKTVLLFQPSEFQAEVWRFVLWEHNIFVIWPENSLNKKQITNYFKTIKSKPNLLIIDSNIDNVYELCRCFHKYYPSSKIILTIDSQHESLSAIRRWAVNQGVDELLMNFQKENLLSSVFSNINCVFKVLDCPAVKRESVLKALDFIEQKNVTIPQGQSRLLAPGTSTQNLEITTEITTNDRSTSPIIHLGFFLVTLLAIVVALDVSILYLISPVQGLQNKILAYSKEHAKILAYNKERTKSTNTKVNSLQEVNNLPQGIFNYGGSTTWAPIRDVVNPKIAKKYPDFNIRYVSAIGGTPGSGTGIRMLLEGQLDFSQSSRPLKQKEYVIAHQQGFTLREYQIAIDAIAIAVAPSLAISGLTIEQLKKIYLGEITNWKEVNGPDLKIVALSRKPEDGGTPEFFQEHVLQSQPFGSNVKYVYSTTDGLNQVKDTPGGIYYASAPEVIPQCRIKSLPIANEDGKFIPPYLPPAVPPENCPKKRNQLNVAAIRHATYPITRYLYVIVRQDGDRSQKGGEAFTKLLLTKEMQKSIEQAGFVPIK